MGHWLAVRGVPALTSALKNDGYVEMSDVLGNVYYVPEAGPIVFLRDADGRRWYCDGVNPGESLTRYLARRRPLRIQYVRAMCAAGLLPRSTMDSLPI